jgi:hypothetical protein
MLLSLRRIPPGERQGNGMAIDAKRDRREKAGRLAALVAELGNVSEACRRLGLDRSAWYRIRKATVSAEGEAPARRRNSAPPGMADAVLDLCLEFPEWGCDRLAHYLTLKGSRVSSPTVQKMLMRMGLGRVAQREAERARRLAAKGNS